jgi:hypothetical protein
MAEEAGLRTEQDGMETAVELGKEGILAMGGELVGPIVKYGGKQLASKFSRTISKVAEEATTPAMKREAAAYMEGLTGVPQLDNMTWLDNPTAVETHQRKIIDWEAKTNGVGYNPVKEEMADEVQTTVQQVRKNMDEAYKAEDQRLQPIIKDLEVDVQPVHQGVLSMVNDLDSEISNIADATSRRHMKRTIDVVKRAVRDDAPVAKQASGNLTTKQVEKEGLDMYGTRTTKTETEATMTGAKS